MYLWTSTVKIQSSILDQYKTNSRWDHTLKFNFYAIFTLISCFLWFTCHDIDEILLKLAININQSIFDSTPESNYSLYITFDNLILGRHGCDHMVVGSTTTYAISAYHQ
jgi:hypothetical protein